jgi:hypothetical protein
MVVRMFRLIQSAPCFLAPFLQIPVQRIAGPAGVGIRFAKSLLRIMLQLFGALARLLTSVIFLALRTSRQSNCHNQHG